ncbi:Hsp33 family molecular chaperone HslO [Rheinheimera baltica]|uniref:33 kDa chaperonin n=1 Tax=Rheinheimera baltica TaxID=67576 RepID=A0ABT9HVL1_9GAMM|nr:Hsp33 family molecular chaperone HslO [Rheinheimera baltica]MDP5135141.1 Hsp33 family molecular chaperone HslO [Rheinheimera baltica]MDP5143576.1 Hsp33 family molecular chaperone HslO [Rheinheimera baltica]MDP5151069.1 Hsp33 family molecular chaperone HslO [Rheinheimera baltica]MDP5189025.1 Hsp33 family molecular chaperone HslO [Rheinheimera baltica]
MNVDNLYRFLFQHKNVRGELVQLSSSLDQMLLHHDYPLPVKQLLAELVAATSLLTATLKFEGDIALQIQGDGPVKFAAVNGTNAQQFRGVVRMQAEISGTSFRELIGEGYLLVTITPQQGERYQGIIPLSGDSLTSTLEAYFAQSEQLPTRLYLYTDFHSEQCRAAGFMLQVLPVDQQKAKADFDELVILADTLTQDEMINLEAEQLLYRLFHQEEVELFTPQTVSFVCGCSREKCSSAIVSLGKDIINEHIAEGKLDISCEYCNSTYHFDSADLTTLLQQL